MIPLSLYLFLFLQLLAVSYGDLKTKKIPNLWSIMNIFLFLLSLVLFPTFYSLQFKTFLYPVSFLLVGFVLFLLHVMGGGDSKYLTSLYFMIPIKCQEIAFLYLLYSTIIIGSLMFIMLSLKRYKDLWSYFINGQVYLIRKIYGAKFSFAPIILFGWIWMGFEMNVHLFILNLVGER